MSSYLDCLFNLPLFCSHAVTNILHQVDEQLTLNTVVDDHSNVGHVQDDEANHREDDKNPSYYQVGAGRGKEGGERR